MRLLLLLLWLPLSVSATDLAGRVVSVADGDTLTLLVGRQQHKIRLAEIDTPEKGQPWGTRAKQALSALAFGKRAIVKQQDVDRYGRIVGRVHVDGLDVNAELVRNGHAWVYRRYSRDPGLLDMEQEARSAKRGLWGLPEAQRVPPWDWRKNKRAGRDTTPETTSRATSCGEKRYCREMVDCAEATFYLRMCGVKTLDGDGDGVPCEALCR